MYVSVCLSEREREVRGGERESTLIGRRKEEMLRKQRGGDRVIEYM